MAVNFPVYICFKTEQLRAYCRIDCGVWELKDMHFFQLFIYVLLCLRLW